MNKIELFISPAEIGSVDKIWKKYSLNRQCIITVAPGSKWFTKMWPVEYYNELLGLLEKHPEFRVIIIGSKDDKKLDIRQTINAVDLRGQTSLMEAAEIIRRSDVLISNDSSPIHIASAFDTYIIALFGPTTRELGFFPWSRNSIVLEVSNLECRPCGLHGSHECPMGHFKCMRDILPKRVYHSILDRVNPPN